MALINQISIARFDSLLSKLLGLKERQVAPSIGTELLPVVPVQDPSAVELSFIAGMQEFWLNDVPFMWGATTASIHSVICLGNPTGSQKLVIIDRIQYDPAPDASQYKGMVKLDWIATHPRAPGFGGVGVGFPAILNGADWNEDFEGTYRDTRWASDLNLGMNMGHALRYFSANKLAAGAVGNGSNCWSANSCVTSPLSLDIQDLGANIKVALWNGSCVLSPGAALLFKCTFREPLNLSIKFNMMWRERPLEQSEERPGSG